MFRDLLTVTVKEIRDLARDKRTLLTAIALPLLLFPLAFALLDLNANRNENAGREPAICAAHNDALALRALQVPGLQIIEGEDVQADLLARRCDLWLTRDTDNSMIFYHDASGRAPLSAAQRALETLQQATTTATHSAPTPRLLPVGDAALARLQLVFSTLLPVLLLIYAASSPIAIAADLTAGERERGSLELLLCLPLGRHTLTAGKFIAGTLFGFLGVLSFAGGILISLALAPGLFEIDSLRVFCSPAALATLLLMALLLTMFFTAAEMAIGAYARGAREAGLLSLPLSILAMAAGYATFPLDARGIADWYYYVPLLNAAALIKELATDIIIPAHIMLVTISLLLCSAAFVAMCARLLSREKSLLRG